MSQWRLMEACRDLLRRPVGGGTPSDGLGLASAQCDVMFDGQPPPNCGELFVSIHEGEWRNQYDEGRQDVIGVEITVTRRVGFIPKDRAVVALADATNSLHQTLDAIAAKIHSNYTVLSLANTALGGSVNGFERPLFFRGMAGKTQPKGPDWFSAPPPDPDNNYQPAECGIARTMIFADAERVQTVESQE